MKKIKRVIFILNCILPVANCLAQDIHFSQYNFSPITLNPAMTCVYKDLQATINYKEQWRSLNAFSTSQATFEMKLNQRNWIKLDRMTETYKKKLVKGLAFGLNFFSDKAGDGNLRQNEYSFSMAYHALLNPNNTLSVGLVGAFAQQTIDPTNLRWNNQYSSGVYDPNLPSGENFGNTSHAYWDFGAGILWSYGEAAHYLTENDQKYINAGIALAHFNQPEQSFITTDPLKRKITAHSNMLFGIKNTHYSIAPSVLYMQQGPQKEITFGTMIKYKLKEESKYTGVIKATVLSVGCFYRNRDAIIPYFLLELDKYTIGITYDANISSLATATTGRGGFEICLRFGTPSPFLYQNSKSRI